MTWVCTSLRMAAAGHRRNHGRCLDTNNELVKKCLWNQRPGIQERYVTAMRVHQAVDTCWGPGTIGAQCFEVTQADPNDLMLKSLCGYNYPEKALSLSAGNEASLLVQLSRICGRGCRGQPALSSVISGSKRNITVIWAIRNCF